MKDPKRLLAIQGPWLRPQPLGGHPGQEGSDGSDCDAEDDSAKLTEVMWALPVADHPFAFVSQDPSAQEPAAGPAAATPTAPEQKRFRTRTKASVSTTPGIDFGVVKRRQWLLDNQCAVDIGMSLRRQYMQTPDTTTGFKFT